MVRFSSSAAHRVFRSLVYGLLAIAPFCEADSPMALPMNPCVARGAC